MEAGVGFCLDVGVRDEHERQGDGGRCDYCRQGNRNGRVNTILI